MSKQKRRITNEKSDSSINTKADRDAIYEIYRSCRLCGAGAGYKMPIFQNIVNIDDTDVELTTKIRECIQIEVHQNDKMPPLICELCVDKVNDFYEFLELCRQTNKRTRIKLGLPLQIQPKEEDEDDCGLTEPVLVKTEESASNQKNKGKSSKSKSSGKKKVQEKIKKEVKNKEKPSRANRELRELMGSNPRPSLSELSTSLRLRNSSSKDDEVKFQEKPSRANRELRELMGSNPRPSLSELSTSLRLRNSSSKDDGEKVQEVATPSPARSKLKRSREREPQIKKEVPSKKVKIAETPPNRSIRKSNAKTEAADSEDDGFIECDQCGVNFPKGRSFGNHYRFHTAEKKNAVEMKCLKCSRTYPLGSFENHKCKEVEKPAIKFTKKHGGKCMKCDKHFGVYRTLMKHQSSCRRDRQYKSTDKIQISAFLHKRLRPLFVRTARCDPLLQRELDGRYDVAGVRCPYGLDRSCVYPYKREQSNSILNYDRMVHIKFDEIAEDLNIDDEIVRWDSDSNSDEDTSTSEPRKIPSLSSLALKTIFSDQLLGKVPKKRKRIKPFDNDFRLNIDNIISNLGEDDKKSSKSIFDNLKDNCSDNVSDSILKNGYDSDRTSFNEEFNDDNVLVDKNKSDTELINNDNNSLSSNHDILGKVNNVGLEESTNSLDSSEGTQKTKETNEISENHKEFPETSNNSRRSSNSNDQSGENGDHRSTSHTCSKSKKCKKTSNNENILEITKEITAMRIDDDGNGETETFKDNDENDRVSSDSSKECPNHLSLVSQADNDGSHTKENINDVDLSEENMKISSESTLNCIENNEISNKNDASDAIVSNNNVRTTKSDENVNDKYINERENLSTVNSEIEVLDIQIISENDEISSDIFVNKDENALLNSNYDQTDHSKSTNDQNSDSLKITETILSSKTHYDNKCSEICSDITMEIELLNEFQTSSKNEEKLDTEVDVEAKNDNNIDDQNSVNSYGNISDLKNTEVDNESIERSAEASLIEPKRNIANSKENVEDKTENSTLIDETQTKSDDENNKTTNGDNNIDFNDLEDISDDDKLMNEIDARIGDSEKANELLNDLLPNQSTDLDSISDGEFAIDD